MKEIVAGGGNVRVERWVRQPVPPRARMLLIMLSEWDEWIEHGRQLKAKEKDRYVLVGMERLMLRKSEAMWRPNERS